MPSLASLTVYFKQTLFLNGKTYRKTPEKWKERENNKKERIKKEIEQIELKVKGSKMTFVSLIG